MSTNTRKRAWPKASGTYDECQSPAYVFDALWPYLFNKSSQIWEPFAGEGILADAMIGRGYRVHRTDIAEGIDFMKLPVEDYKGSYTDYYKDCPIISNPPFSIKYDVLAKCYQLGMPFALLMPVETACTAAFRDIVYATLRPQIHIRYMLPRPSFKMPNLGWLGKGSQFPTAWFCHNFPGLLDGEFSYCNLDQKRVAAYHKQMAATQELTVSITGGYTHILDRKKEGLYYTTLCGFPAAVDNAKALDLPLQNLCPDCQAKSSELAQSAVARPSKRVPVLPQV